ncbi:L-rhamnose-binding lectin CSL3-like isoform X2 [Acanthochromis polyacanthus]|uniref:L-rhamnose-binding lectin CSL3-like isoform X2 n=1 Tax=Acanthochromis polyacanthus TaxID=80966 RepID=UPI00223440FA|nr:L-rhamnose-binding lectin CSL3-like isoform X2 [Acanthochromis polyacanthus]
MASFPLMLMAACLLMTSEPGSCYEYHSVTCEGSEAHLNCGQGHVISVLRAVYGRQDKITCSYGRPASQIQNDHCSRLSGKVAERCNGRMSCSIKASNSEFGDPCRGTYKYLDVTYTCEEPGDDSHEVRSVTCENSVAYLKCGQGLVISVLWADYGRHDRTTCSSGRPASQIQNVHCSRPTGKVAERCNGRMSCSIKASNSEFGDPCRGTYKYLDVTYTCEEPGDDSHEVHSVTCEGSVAYLTCDQGLVISVLRADYGRHDRTTCSSGRPAHQIQNVHCSRLSGKVAERCNGKRSCSIQANNWEFGDPCWGTYKYLDVAYTCNAPVIAANPEAEIQ